MPPEVLSGEDITSSPAIDVWAIGVIFYILVTGEHPFKGRN
jgi:serine/threonine protein kinase